MILQLSIGTLIMVTTLVIAAIFVLVALRALVRFGPWVVREPHAGKFMIVMLVMVLWIQLAMTIAVWVWALTFLVLGIFDGLEPSVYFAIVSFTTLGFGDVLLPKEWRLLSGLAASNGLIYFGFFTAVLVEVMRRVRQEQIEGRPSRE